MYCYKCGTKLPDDAEYCFKCGAKMPSKTEDTKVLEQTEVPDTATIQKEAAKDTDVKDSATNITNSSNNNPAGSNLSSKTGSILALIVFLIVGGLARTIVRDYYRSSPGQQHYMGMVIASYIGAMIVGFLCGIIPAYVAYKYGNFENPVRVAIIILIIFVIVGMASGLIATVPLAIISLIVLFFRKK
jgi:fluoride ion exporter CrcB/FEX